MTKQSFVGGYDLETIKWFTPTDLILSIVCPYCGSKLEIDAGDDFIEYPKESQQTTLYCDECERGIDAVLKISMTTRIDIELVDQTP